MAEPGNLVEFEANPVNDSSAQIVGDVTLVKEEKAATVAAATGGTKTSSYADRDASIQYQSSRKDAIEFVGLILKADAVKLPAKQADKLESLEALVDHYTSKFLTDIGTQGAVSRAAGEENSPTDDTAKPTGDEE